MSWNGVNGQIFRRYLPIVTGSLRNIGCSQKHIKSSCSLASSTCLCIIIPTCSWEWKKQSMQETHWIFFICSMRQATVKHWLNCMVDQGGLLSSMILLFTFTKSKVQRDNFRCIQWRKTSRWQIFQPAATFQVLSEAHADRWSHQDPDWVFSP